MRRRLPFAFVVLAGCAARFPMPMTAGELVRYDTGPALVAYLGQPDASPTVCDVRVRGPHLPAFTPEIREALVDGLVDGAIEPVLWRRCVKVALDGLIPDAASSLLDDTMRAYAKLLRDSDLQVDPRRAERVAALQRAYLERRPGVEGHAAILTTILDDLRAALANHELGPVASSFAVDVIATADVERGVWQGHPIDLALMDALAAAGNEMTLTRFAQRLPRPDLRTEASRRILRIHIALSAFDEVRAAATEVEDKVIKDGHNRVALGEHPLVRAWFDERRTTIRNVLVRQHVWAQTATLLGYSQQRPTLSVLPELSFRGALWAEVQAVSRPITLCSPKRALDPTPCIEITDVSLDNPFAYLDKGSAFHFRDNVVQNEIVPWASLDLFTLPVGLGGQPAVSLRWGLYYERPDDLAFHGAASGGRGPDLEVHVDHPNPNRYVFTVNGYAAVVEAADLANFHVASRGAGGEPGSDGSDGSDGSSGSECGNGSDGTDGGPGGDGGNGGDGGDVHAVIACGPGPCDVDLLERIIYSAGGDGGAGGSGGRGGSGGSGGSGRSESSHTDSDGNTVVDDAGCSAGSSGSSGSSGMDGSSGSPGQPGRVSFDVVH